MTPDLGIEPGPHWWEVSALHHSATLHPECYTAFSICINSTTTKYGLPDMEYFENLVQLSEIETALLFIQT